MTDGPDKESRGGGELDSSARRAHVFLLENVAPMVDLAMPGPFDEVLDVGCHQGYVGRVFAPYVRKVVGIDADPARIEEARKAAGQAGLGNLEFEAANVEEMPFPDGSFDIVASRFAFHHFREPRRALGEVRRVSRQMARIVLYDILSSADDGKAELHNEIERERDPSHVRMLQDREWRALFRRAGLEARARISVLMQRDFELWMDVVEAPPERRERVRRLLLEKGAPRNAAGLGVRQRGGRLTFTHTCAVWLLVQA